MGNIMYYSNIICSVGSQKLVVNNTESDDTIGTPGWKIIYINISWSKVFKIFMSFGFIFSVSTILRMYKYKDTFVVILFGNKQLCLGSDEIFEMNGS